MDRRTLNRRDFLRMSAVAVTGSMLVGCTASMDQPEAGDQAAPSAEELTLTVATDWNSGPRKEFMDHMTAYFQETHPDVTVEVWHMGSGGTSGPGGMGDIVKAQMLTDTAADVLPGFAAGSLDWASQYLLDISDLAAAAGFERDNFYYSPNDSYDAEGRLRVLPFNDSVSGWIYNKTIFEEEGVDPPTEDWTFDDMVEAAKRLTNPDKDQYGVWVAGQRMEKGPFEHMFSAGGTHFTQALLHSGWCNGRSPEMFQRWIDLIYVDKVSPEPGEAAAMESTAGVAVFASGRIAMQPQLLSNLGALIRQIGDRFEFSVMPTPKDPQTSIRAFDLINDGNAIFHQAAERGTAELAVEYTMAMITDPGQAFVIEHSPTFPTNRAWAHKAEFLEPPPDNKELILTARETYEPMPRMFFEHWGEARRAFTSEFDKAYTGEVPAQDALAAACAAVDAVLADFADEIEPWAYDFGFPLEGMTRENSEWF